MVKESSYDPVLYDLSRPLYPPELFESLKPLIGAHLPDQLQFLDLGCGTGLVARSILQCFRSLPFQLTLLDVDSRLIQLAQEKLSDSSVKSFVSSAEHTPLPDQSVDVAFIGSAWHWFRAGTAQELARVIRPGGGVFIFEYQFPKMNDDTLGLNNWVRRQFNETWKFTDQEPRGDLRSITSSIRAHSEFAQIASPQVRVIQTHSSTFFSDILFSQARYLDFEARAEIKNKLDERTRVRGHLEQHFNDPEKGSFLYTFDGYLFQKRWI